MDADDLVLVALAKSPRDLEIARVEHWYRIPAKHAPPHFAQATYLAFYLTRAFDRDKWSIREYAPVRGHELVRRNDLFPGECDHPRAQEPYFKLELGPLLSLPRPIVSRAGRRLLFVWTTGDRFLRAVELNDLLGRTAADDALWDALKESNIRAERRVTVHDARLRYRVDFWIPCTRGDLVIALAERPRRLPKGKRWRALQFSEMDVLNRRGDCIRRIRLAAQQVGGAGRSQG